MRQRTPIIVLLLLSLMTNGSTMAQAVASKQLKELNVNNDSTSLKHNPFLRPSWLPLNATPVIAKKRIDAELTLRGTVNSSSTPMALINEQALTIGESIEGYRVVNIGEGQVSLVKEGEELLLKVGEDNN